MSAKEVGLVVMNCIIIAGLFVLIGLKMIPLDRGLEAMFFLLVPSAGPLVVNQLRGALAPKGPPEGASVIEKDGGK